MPLKCCLLNDWLTDSHEIIVKGGVADNKGVVGVIAVAADPLLPLGRRRPVITYHLYLRPEGRDKNMSTV
jgi:hypothetical protein